MAEEDRHSVNFEIIKVECDEGEGLDDMQADYDETEYNINTYNNQNESDFPIAKIESQPKRQRKKPDKLLNKTGKSSTLKKFQSKSTKPKSKKQSSLANNQIETESPHECPHCGETFARKNNLTKHLKTHSDNDNKNKIIRNDPSRCHLQCDLCLKFYRNNKILKVHKETVHMTPKSEKPHKCTICCQTFTQKSSLTQHSRTKHSAEGSVQFLCEFCPKMYSGQRELNDHKVKVHMTDEDKPFKCHVCHSSFIDEANLKRHVNRRHKEADRYRCDICSKAFRSLREVKEHVKTIHFKVYFCDRCLTSFDNLTEFEDHSKTRNSSEASTSTSLSKNIKSSLEFHCQICSSSFETQCNLNLHTESHLKQLRAKGNNSKNANNNSETKETTSIVTNNCEFVFECEICSKTFVNESHFNAHARNAHKDAEWTCKICSKSYALRYLLKHHEMIHAEVRPFQCNLCPKSYYRQIDLKVHSVVHEKDKAHKCEKCSSTFYRASSLKRHLFTAHGEEVRFNCELCKKTCLSSKVLEKHMSTMHSEERPFKCAVCSKCFRWKRNLKNHEKTAHFSK